MPIGQVGFRNGNLILKNISFDYTNLALPGEPANMITANGQILIGSIGTTPNIAMKPGFLHSAGSLTINYNPGTGNIDIDSNVAGGTLSTLTPDIGGPITPDLANINVKGLPILAGQTRRLQTETTKLAGANLQIKAPNCALFIVDHNALYGTHTTVQSAIDDAAIQFVNSGERQTIFVRAGIYQETITLVDGVNLSGYSCDSNGPNVCFLGQTNIPASGRSFISGVRFQTDGAAAINASAGNGLLRLDECWIHATNVSAVRMSVPATLIAVNTFGDCTTGTASYFAISNSATLTFIKSHFSNNGGSSVQNTCAGARLDYNYTYFLGAVTYTGSGSFSCFWSMIGGGGMVTPVVSGPGLTFAGTGGPHIVSNSSIGGSGGSQPAMIINGTASISFLGQNMLSNTNGTTMASGTGTILYNPFTLSGPGQFITITNQNASQGLGPRIPLATGGHIMSGTGTPNTFVTAPIGSLFLRTDGGATVNNRAYINTNGGTAWTAFLTAS